MMGCAVLLLALKTCFMVGGKMGHSIYLQVDKPTLTKTREEACQVFNSVTAPESTNISVWWVESGLFLTDSEIFFFVSALLY